MESVLGKLAGDIMVQVEKSHDRYTCEISNIYQYIYMYKL